MAKRQRAYVYRPSAGTKNIDVTESATLQARMDAKSQFNPATGCLLWFGALNKGYGVTSVGRVLVPAHVASYKLSGKTVPLGYQVDHLCKDPRCINPAHLEAVPPSVNNARSNSRSALNLRKTHCESGHEFTAENTKVTKTKTGTARICRKCIAVWKKRHNPRRNELRRLKTQEKRNQDGQK